MFGKKTRKNLSCHENTGHTTINFIERWEDTATIFACNCRRFPHVFPSVRSYLYPIALGLLLAIWAGGMHLAGRWGVMAEHWEMSLTMVLGSFIAGSTPAGGASVAFPVFTKLLDIQSQDAALFGLMIQSVGMTMAAIFIVSRRIPFYPVAYRWAATGGCLGVVPALLFLRVPAPFPKLLFSCVALVFGGVLFWLHWKSKARDLPDSQSWTLARKRNLLLTGFVGGLLASQLGSGADMIVFIAMIVAYGLDPKRSIPTTVLTMATVSVIGFLTKLAFQRDEIGVVWDYWLACVPVVAIGAPLGAHVLSKLPQRTVIIWVLSLITLDVASTLLVVPLNSARIGFMGAVLLVAGIWVGTLVRLPRVPRPRDTTDPS